MPRHPHYIPHGVIPAVLLPFNDDLAIDEKSFRSHLRDVAAIKGLSAVTINAHSTEVASCSFDEQRRVLDVTQDEIGDRLPIVNGVWADGSIEAARIARMAADGGASALLVFPPAPFTLGQSPEMALAAPTSDDLVTLTLISTGSENDTASEPQAARQDWPEPASAWVTRASRRSPSSSCSPRRREAPRRSLRTLCRRYS